MSHIGPSAYFKERGLGSWSEPTERFFLKDDLDCVPFAPGIPCVLYYWTLEDSAWSTYSACRRRIASVFDYASFYQAGLDAQTPCDCQPAGYNRHYALTGYEIWYLKLLGLVSATERSNSAMENSIVSIWLFIR